MAMSDRSIDVYLRRVNRGIDMIMNDPGGELGLERVAAESGFSPFHFHRIFKNATGQTLAEFVNRVRLDRARTLMSQRPDLSLTEVALTCGLGSSSNYSRVFKKRFGVPPRAFDADAHWVATNDERAEPYRHLRVVSADLSRFSATTVAIEKRFVAYLRVTNPYGPGRVSDAARHLADWADRSSVSGGWIGYTWDNPDFVAAADCTYCLGLEVDTAMVLEEPMGLLELPAMTVAEVKLDRGLGDEAEVIDWLYAVWLPLSGYQPTNYPTFETWERSEFGKEAEYRQLTVGLPVTRL